MMRTSADKATPETASNRRVANRSIRTFLADDSPFMLALVARILAKDQRIVLLGSTTEGRKVLCRASTLSLDLVLVDLHMPGLGGADTTRLLKQRSNPPIVFVVTSDDSPESRIRCRAAGADAFLVKKVNLAVQLHAAIEYFFGDDVAVRNEQSDGSKAIVATKLVPLIGGLRSGAAHEVESAAAQNPEATEHASSVLVSDTLP